MAVSVAGSLALAAACRSDTSVSMLSPTMNSIAPSISRVVTKPMAAPSCWRFTTEKRATAVPMPAMPVQRSRNTPQRIWPSFPAVSTALGSVSTGA